MNRGLLRLFKMENLSRGLNSVIACLVVVITSGVVDATEARAAERSRIRITQSPEGYLFEENGDPILFYQSKTKSIDGKFPRADYIHPLYDLDGNILTEDFPDDHLHQRGVFWAWHQVRVDGRAIADPWSCERIEWANVCADVTTAGAHSSTLRVTLHWKCPLTEASAANPADWQPIVEETTCIRVYPRTERVRKIDFEIRLLALVDNLMIGGSEDEKGYGGFSARIRLPQGLRFTGRGGPITPQFGAIDVGPWVDFSAKFGRDERVSGLTILGHRTLPQFPPHWVLRERGSMQNPVYPGRLPVGLSRTGPTVLRYRLVVHRDGAEQLDLDNLQRAYEREN